MLFVSALCIPLFLLATYQHYRFGSLPVALQSIQSGMDFHSFGDTTIPLISSTFGNAEKYARYCTLCVFLALGMLGDLQLSRTRRVFAITSACAGLGGIFLSGRRAPLYLSLVGLTFVVWKIRYLASSITVWISLLLILLIAAFTIGKPSEKIATNSDYFVSSIPVIGERVDFLLEEVDVVAVEAGIFGHGTGAGSGGLDYVPGGAAQLTKEGTSIENGLTKVWWELGPFGLAIFLLFWVMAGVLLFKKLFRVWNSGAQSYVLGYVTYFCIIFIWFSKGHQIMADFSTGIQHWLFFGIIAGLPSIQYSRSSPKPAPLRIMQPNHP